MGKNQGCRSLWLGKKEAVSARKLRKRIARQIGFFSRSYNVETAARTAIGDWRRAVRFFGLGFKLAVRVLTPWRKSIRPDAHECRSWLDPHQDSLRLVMQGMFEPLANNCVTTNTTSGKFNPADNRTLLQWICSFHHRSPAADHFEAAVRRSQFRLILRTRQRWTALLKTRFCI
jgi:hypothetical protein